MEILFDTVGGGKAIYDEMLDLSSLGQVSMKRVSYVNPEADNKWYADLELVKGPKLGPFDKYSEAVAAEVAWLRENYLDSQRAALLTDVRRLKCYLTPEQFQAVLTARRFSSSMLREHRGSYTAVYRTVWVYPQVGKRLAIMEIGPYKYPLKSSLFYTPESPQEAAAACLAEAEEFIQTLKRVREAGHAVQEFV